MAIYALGGAEPKIHPTAFVHPDAVVIGNVIIGEEASIWPCAVLRGDGGQITIGPRTSIQDGSVLHTNPEFPTIVGEECVIGHLVHLEGCIIEPRSLVGSGAVVLDGAIIRSGALVGANAVVPARVEVPSGAMALGVPVKIRLDVVEPFYVEAAMRTYVERGRTYRAQLRRLDT